MFVCSIIVNNYNYERFLRTAIDSALEQTYPNVEVLVVDDCSTDGSRDIIASYGDRITPILHNTNGKQGVAFNNGFAHSKGDVVIFLDADDYLYPNAAERIVEAWRPGTAKVHYRLDVVDGCDRSKGFSLPQGQQPLDGGSLQESIFKNGSYCSVPTSGNALSRQAMEPLFPIPLEFTTTSDDYLSVLIPLYGDVVAIKEPLGAYRIHESNQWALVELDSSRFRRFIAHDLQRCSLLKERGAALGYDVPNDLELRTFGPVWSRLTSLRLDPVAHPVETDSAIALVVYGLRALWLYSEESLRKRILFSLWFLWVGLAPLSLAKPAIRWLFMRENRPRPWQAVKSSFSRLFATKQTSPIRYEPQSPRVLFVSHAYMVGVNQGKLAAIARQVKVGLLAPRTWQSSGWNRTLSLETPYPEIQTYPSNIPFSGRGGAYFFNPLKIWQVLRQFKPDIIQAEVEVFSLCALEFAIVSRITKIPLVVFAWENMERQLLFRKWIRDFVLKTAPLIIAGNHEGGQLLKKWNYTGQIEVIPQIGVDELLFKPKATSSPSSEITIGFVGRIVPEKGIDLLLQATKRLQQQALSFKIVVCGSGKARPSLEQEVQQLGLTAQIIWQDAVPHEQVPAELKKFDVLVLPSRSVDTWREQFGHVLIEAMAMGIPTVGSTCGEIPNVINHPDLVFDEGNAAALATILARLIRDEAFRQKMGQYCLQRAHQHYTHERIAQKSINLWKSVLKKSSANRPIAVSSVPVSSEASGV